MKDLAAWNKWVENNTDPYGAACIKVAKRVMELLDEDATPLHMGYHPDVHTTHGIICKADEDTNAGGITGFMAGCVAEIVCTCHERGEEFRIIHNGKEVSDGVINHAIIRIG